MIYVNPASLDALHITRKRIWLCVLVGFALILPGWFVDSWYSYISGEGWWEFGVAKSPPLILSIVAIAVSEEFFFRGYLLGRLKELNRHRWQRVLLVNATFIFYKVLVHAWEGWPLLNYIELFAVGMVEMLFETFWVDWTGSIVTPIIIHIGWDLIVFHDLTTLPYWAI